MEESRIDLKRFIPKKANKWYFIKVFVYAIILAGLFVYLKYELDHKKSIKLEDTLIKTIKIDSSSN